MKKIILSVSVVFLAVISVIVVQATTSFIDDNKIQNYSREYVEQLVENGGISGYDDNSFKPQGNISRIEFLNMCVNSICDLDELVKTIDSNEYDKIIDKYKYDEIWNGKANDVLAVSFNFGLSKEFSENGSPNGWNKPITRAEACNMIYNCLAKIKNESFDSNFDINSIGDFSLIQQSGYSNAIKAVFSAGIVQGDSKGFFNPNNNLTREDSAILICKAMDKEKRQVMKPVKKINNSVVVGEVGVKSIKNFIKTAFEPVGRVMYIYGGGWNEADNGAGTEAMTLGLSQSWLDFTSKQNASYNYAAYDYKKNVNVIHNGLDCSGYVGWVIYNVLNDGKGYVTNSYKMDDMLAQAGYGKIYPKNTYSKRYPGDIMASGCDDCKHVYICIGQCSDGSVLLLHSSPPGVQLTGTYTPNGNKNSEAIKLATQYMKKYYPDWYKKYPDSSRNTSYLTHYDKFEWTSLSDPDGYKNMTPAQILKDIFGE